MRNRLHFAAANGEQSIWQILYIVPDQADAESTARHMAAGSPHLLMHTVTASRDALALLAPGHAFDLILTDLRVPDMSAMEFMREIQLRGLEIPVIVITGQGDEASAAAILSMGAYDYIVKRDDYLTHLSYAIDHALHRSRLNQASSRLNAEAAALSATIEQKVASRTSRLRQELELQQASEASFRNLVESTHDLVQSVGPDGKFIFVNNAWCATLGWTREEALQLGFSQIIKPDQLAHCQSLFEELRKGKNFSQVEVTFVARDGREIIVEGNLSSIFVDGAFAGTQSFFRDISERKRTEAELRERERQLSTLISSLPGLAYRCRNDADYTMEFVSDGIENLTGYPAEDFVQHRRAFGQLIHPDDQEQVWDNIQAALQKRQPYELTYRIHTFSGAKKWVWEKGQGIHDSHGQLLALEGFVTDITERKHADEALRESERRLRTIIETEPECVKVVDRQGNLLEMNAAGLAMLEAESLDKVQQYSLLNYIVPEYHDAFRELHKRVMKGESGALEFEVIGLRGTRRWLETHAAPMRDKAGAVVSLLGITRDVTERKKAEAQVKLAAKVFEQSGEAFIITDANRNIVMVNHAFTAITGYSEAEAVGKNPRMLYSGYQDQDFYRAMWEAINTHGHWQGEMLDRRKDGSVYPKWLTVSRVLDEQGKVTHYIGIFSDITQHKQNEEYIQRLAHFDALTGLPNRVLLNDRISLALSAVQRSHMALAVMFVDLDHFKNVNDTLGHRIGDALLVEVAKRLKSVVREEDTVSRLGGDEFIFVLPGTDIAGAAHVAEKLLETVSQRYQIEQHELIITPSIGIAIYPNDGDNFELLSRCADIAMYRAKRDGRNNYRFFTPEMQASSARTLQLENALRHALARNQLQLHYQPQIALQDGSIIGVEALLRWQHPELGPVSPAEFIPVAEDSGQILQIGEWVLRTAVRQIKTWIDSGMAPMVMAVNLSVVQFRQPNLPDIIARILEEAQLPPKYLELELTEGVAMDNPLGAIAMMDKLHQRGIRMSIDDFGTGYSSLSYLKRFQIYKLKIDQSFVRDITIDPEDRAIVGAIIRLAEALGLQTIAEGVETEGQLAFLREQGCNEMQGNYFSEPLPFDQFEALMKKRAAGNIKKKAAGNIKKKAAGSIKKKAAGSIKKKASSKK